jgi:hypothetical protein
MRSMIFCRGISRNLINHPVFYLLRYPQTAARYLKFPIDANWGVAYTMALTERCSRADALRFAMQCQLDKEI